MTAPIFIPPPCYQEVGILYEDDHILLINKPSGLLSLSGKNTPEKDSVYKRILEDYPSAKMIHRLDFGTSGVMVVALNKRASARLNKQFELRTVVKQYIATLYGHVIEDEGEINAPIARGEFPYQKICSESGKSALSHFKVLGRYQQTETGIKTTQVIYTPRTGRTHQLRIHSQLMAHPIIGCDLYNATINGVDTHSLASRLCLHALRLTFFHPITYEKMSMECPTSFNEFDCA